MGIYDRHKWGWEWRFSRNQFARIIFADVKNILEFW